MNWGEAMDLLVAGVDIVLPGPRPLRLHRSGGGFSLVFGRADSEMSFSDAYTALETVVRVAGQQATARAVSAARYRCWFPIGSSLGWHSGAS